ncbi:MAG: hypothetical protein JST54_28945 [Deltaproteobacteria bacterium]|nr:hypothetical protein [Deltaproteobacteria bacterium]
MASKLDEARPESMGIRESPEEDASPGMTIADAEALARAESAEAFDGLPSTVNAEDLGGMTLDREPPTVFCESEPDGTEGIPTYEPSWPWEDVAPPPPETPREPRWVEIEPPDDTRCSSDEPEPEPHDPIAMHHLLAIVMSKKWYGQLYPTELMTNIQRWFEEGTYNASDMLEFPEKAANEFRAAHLAPGETPEWPGEMSAKRAGALLRTLMLRKRVDHMLVRLTQNDEKVHNYYCREACKLWEAVIGGTWEKEALMSLIDIIAHASELVAAESIHAPHAVALALGAFRASFPEAGARVELNDFEQAVEKWRAAGRKKGKRPSKWKALKELATKAGLRPPSAETIKREYRDRKADIPI